MRDEKSWWTPARIARGPDAAREELARWRANAPRIMDPYGHPVTREYLQGLRAKWKAAHHGRAVEAPEHKTQVDRSAGQLVTAALVGVAAVGGGILIGRWWKQRQRTSPRVHGNDGFNVYLHGTDVLGAA